MQNETAYSKPVTLKNILTFAIPTIAMSLFMSFYTMVDGLFVSNLVGTTALSAINLVYPVIALVTAISTMLATGGSAAIMKKMGEQKADEAKQDFTFLILVNVIVGLVMCGIGYVFMGKIFGSMSLSAEVSGYCLEYLSRYLLFTVPILLMNNFTLYMIAAGKATLSLVCSIAGGVTNIVLDYLFIAVFDFGISYLLLEWAGFRHSLLIAGALFVIGGLISEYRWFTKKRDYILKRYQEIPQTILERRNGENQMNEQIVLREYHKSDRPALEGVIREAWHYDRFCSPKTAQKMARVYLANCLANQTFTQVALIDDVPVGIIMGKNNAKHKCPFPFRMQLIGAIISLYLSKEGRQISKIFEGINGIDKELLSRCGKDYQGELAFFAISKKCRGKGLGKQMFEKVMEYMRTEQIPEFYLFTDTSCNYPFYEHMGLTRRCEKKQIIDVKGEKGDMTFFIYDYQVGRE